MKRFIPWPFTVPVGSRMHCNGLKCMCLGVVIRRTPFAVIVRESPGRVTWWSKRRAGKVAVWFSPPGYEWTGNYMSEASARGSR